MAHGPGRYLESEDNQGRVAGRLIRRSFESSRRRQIFGHTNHVFYWRGKKGGEADFVPYDGRDVEVPTEARFRNQIRRGSLGGMIFLDGTGREKGVVVSKNDMGEERGHVMVPAAVFLLP